MTARKATCLAVLVAVAGLCPPALADEPDVTLFLGTTRGGDAQLHHELRPVECNCAAFPATLAGDRVAPPLATLGVAIAGTSGMIRGGVELFGVFAATGDTSGYAGGVTFIGIERWRLYGVGGVGLGRYVASGHNLLFDSIAGSLRAEMGVRLARGWALGARLDVLQNDISTARLASFGLSWAPPW